MSESQSEAHGLSHISGGSSSGSMRGSETLTVEAGSAEAALAEVNARLGPDAQILDARKVQRGGIGGFFAKELVQLTARGRNEVGSEFEPTLRRALADTEPPAAVPAAPPAEEAASWRLSGGAGWSVTALARMDLPSSLLDAVMGLDPRDDLGWIAAIAGAVAPWCRPLPAGSCVLLGPGAGRLGAALDLPVSRPGGMPPYRGDVALVVDGERGDREWLETVRGERWGHLVVDGGNERRLLDDEVLAVSWSSDEGVTTALRLASSLGLVLGYGMSSALGSPAFRATPVDVALAVRSLAGRR